MQYADSASDLLDLLEKSKVVYLYTEPEVLDFTNLITSGKLIIAGNGKRIELQFSHEETPLVIGLLSASVFDDTQVETILAWDLKSLLSYALFHTKKQCEIKSPIFDLKIIENFLGVSQPKPTSLVEAIRRLKAVSQDGAWRDIYKKVHIPLATQILPEIETTPLLDVNKKDAFYAHYNIEGQQNGRLLCSRQFEKGLLAHTLDAEQKAALRPRGYNMGFISGDIRNCEVAVLQWLSQDTRLKLIMESEKDLYRVIYELITGDKCDTVNKRKMSQNMFLAVIYGSQARGLSRSLNVPEDVAAELRKRIIQKFPKCWGCLQDFQERAEKETVRDYFGRPRNFTEKPYLARNFFVQGVAATACLDKLIELYGKLKSPTRICFSVHDGYGIVVPLSQMQEHAKIVSDVLESPSRVCPGLKMRAKVEMGKTLDQLAIYKPEENYASYMQ